VIDERGEVMRPPQASRKRCSRLSRHAGRSLPFAEELDQMRQGVVIGLRDYERKNGFEQVLVGRQAAA